MISLDQQHPEVAKEFHKRNFVIHKSGREFSSLAIDQTHEHNNSVIKDGGDAIGLTENKELRRWMVARPDFSSLVARYEAMSSMKDVTYSSKHHDQTLSAQKSLFEKVKSFSAVMQEVGNPFQEESAALLVLDTKNIADPTLAARVATRHWRDKKAV